MTHQRLLSARILYGDSTTGEDVDNDGDSVTSDGMRCEEDGNGATGDNVDDNGDR